MQFVLVTGPSGTGKSFVAEVAKNKIGNALRVVDIDKIFSEASRILCPYYAAPRWKQEIWWKLKDLPIDFESLFRNVLKSYSPNDAEFTLVEGVQLRIDVWYDAFAKALDFHDANTISKIAIIPAAEILLANRLNGKAYHKSVATKDECESAIKWFNEWSKIKVLLRF